MYKIQQEGVQRLSDSACIPADTGNLDWQEYQKWIEAGNVAQPADPVPEPSKATVDAGALKADVNVQALVAMSLDDVTKEVDRAKTLDDLKALVLTLAKTVSVRGRRR